MTECTERDCETEATHRVGVGSNEPTPFCEAHADETVEYFTSFAANIKIHWESVR